MVPQPLTFPEEDQPAVSGSLNEKSALLQNFGEAASETKGYLDHPSEPQAPPHHRYGNPPRLDVFRNDQTYSDGINILNQREYRNEFGNVYEQNPGQQNNLRDSSTQSAFFCGPPPANQSNMLNLQRENHGQNCPVLFVSSSLTNVPGLIQEDIRTPFLFQPEPEGRNYQNHAKMAASTQPQVTPGLPNRQSTTASTSGFEGAKYHDFGDESKTHSNHYESDGITDGYMGGDDEDLENAEVEHDDPETEKYSHVSEGAGMKRKRPATQNNEKAKRAKSRPHESAKATGNGTRRRHRAKPSKDNLVFPNTIPDLGAYLARQTRIQREKEELLAQGKPDVILPDAATQRKYCRMLFNAFIYVGPENQDRPTKKEKVPQAPVRIKNGSYPAVYVQNLCWEMMSKATFSQLGIHNTEEHDNKKLETFVTWEDRMDYLIEVLTKSKACCKWIADADNMCKFVDAPMTEAKNKIANFETNAKRNEETKFGRAVIRVTKGKEDDAENQGERNEITGEDMLAAVKKVQENIDANPKSEPAEAGSIGSPANDAPNPALADQPGRSSNTILEEGYKETLCELLRVNYPDFKYLTLHELRLYARAYNRDFWNQGFYEGDGMDRWLRNHFLMDERTGEVIHYHFALDPYYSRLYQLAKARGDVTEGGIWRGIFVDDDAERHQQDLDSGFSTRGSHGEDFANIALGVAPNLFGNYYG